MSSTTKRLALIPEAVETGDNVVIRQSHGVCKQATSVINGISKPMS